MSAGGLQSQFLHGDDLEWPRWKDFCNNLVGTVPTGKAAAANNGTDVRGHGREVFLHAAYLLHRWNTMIPRSRASPAPKPASARSALNAVRRVHARAPGDHRPQRLAEHEIVSSSFKFFPPQFSMRMSMIQLCFKVYFKN